jgi:branched-chain amino acid transport system substrate-binding protein
MTADRSLLKRRSLHWLAVVAALAMLVVAGCGSDDGGSSDGGSGDGAQETGDITIGEVIGASGWLTAFDIPPSEGAQIAIDEINAEGGIDGRKLKMVRADHQSDPANVPKATQEALSKGADVVLASCNYEEAGPTARIASQQDKVTISYCGGEPKFTRQVGDANKLVFDMGNETNGVGAVMAQFAYDQDWRSAYVLEDTYLDYTRQMAEFFEASWKTMDGTSITGSDTFKNGDASIAGQIASIKSKQDDTDVLVLASTLPGATTAIRQIRAAGIDLPILTGDGMDSRSVAKSVPNLNDFYMVASASVYGDDPDPKINEFFEKYEQQTGSPADGSYAIFGYSIIQALKAAIEKSGSANGPELAEALETFDEEPVLVGPLTFTAEQHVDPFRAQEIIEYKNGKPQHLTTVTPKDVPDPF